MKIELLVGMIASGKSTYCSARAVEGAIIVSDDAIVQAIHGGNYDLYDSELKSLYHSIEDYIVVYAINNGLDIIVDRTNLTRNSRRRFIEQAEAYSAQIIAVKFRVEMPQIHATRRADSDSRGYDYQRWLDIATEHYNKYEVPTLHEGFNDIIELPGHKKKCTSDGRCNTDCGRDQCYITDPSGGLVV